MSVRAFLFLAAASASSNADLGASSGLAAVINDVSAPGGVRRAVVCLGVPRGQDRILASIELGFGRRVVPLDECATRGQLFLHLPSGERAISVEFTKLDLKPGELRGS